MTVPKSAGYALSFQACPLLFTTAGVDAVASSETDFPTAATLMPGYLANTGWSWTERCSPIEGSLECSGLSFTVHDLPVAVTTGPLAAGARPITWLGTRKFDNVGYTQLTSTLGALDLAIVVDRGAALGTFPRVVYVDQEAILCDSIATNTITINASGRGYYGTAFSDSTNGTAHIVRTNPDNKPPVFADFPTFYRRKVVLWRVSETGAATPIWRGYVTSNPQYDGKETAYKFACQHLWNLERQRPLGVPAVSTRLRGFNTAAFTALVAYSGASTDLWRGAFPHNPQTAATLDEACGIVTARLREILATDGLTNTASISVTGDSQGVTFKFSMSLGILPSPTLTLTVGNHVTSGSSGLASNPRQVTIVLECSPTALWDPNTVVPVSSVDGFPSVWYGTANTTNGLTTTMRYVLRGDIDDSHKLLIEPDSTSTSTFGSIVTGHYHITGERRAGRWVETAVQLFLNARVDSPHWALALRYGIVNDAGVVNPGIDTNSWDWSQEGRVLNATDGGPNARTYYLDGTQTLDKLLGDTCRLSGCGIGLRGSKMSVFPFEPPLASDAVALTVTTASLCGPPAWSALTDGIVNTVSIAGDGVNVVVNDLRSSNLYGPSRPLKLTLAGVDGYTAHATPDSLARFAMSRATGLWSDPAASCTVATTIANLESVYIGDYVSISEYAAPVGDGTRGLSAARGQVIGRKITIPKSGGDGGVELEVLLYPHTDLAGYAPCCRVASITTDTLTIATAYLTSSSTATDYAGSNLTSYPFYPSVANDGGASHFVVGDLVQLIEVDNVSPRTPQTFTILAVTAGTPSIRLSASPNAAWQTIIAGGGYVELVYQDYGNGSVLVATQEAFCFVGDETGEVIGSSTDHSRRFS